ncbi:MAG: ATP-binding cassette domain-containing protein [Alphaproteobacteria bacterium]|nr:ATP-binding cassette domain-containing protein [Alphaproteobacteria bacterium]
MADAPAKIRLDGITRSFDGHKALDGLSLSGPAGQALALIGPSGSGKTLVLKSILGLVAPDSGRVLVDGEDIASLAAGERRQRLERFGVLFQRQGLFDSLPVWENVAFRLINDRRAGRRLGRRAARQRAIEVLERVGLDAAVADLFPSELSGGMAKRVGLARAIAAEPEIVLLDEPTAGLDPIMTNVIDALIVDLMRRIGATVIAVSSDMASVGRISHSVAMLDHGRVVWQGPTATLRRSGNPWVHQFVNQLAEGPIATSELATA